MRFYEVHQTVSVSYVPRGGKLSRDKLVSYPQTVSLSEYSDKEAPIVAWWNGDEFEAGYSLPCRDIDGHLYMPVYVSYDMVRFNTRMDFNSFLLPNSDESKLHCRRVSNKAVRFQNIPYRFVYDKFIDQSIDQENVFDWMTRYDSQVVPYFMSQDNVRKNGYVFRFIDPVVSKFGFDTGYNVESIADIDQFALNAKYFDTDKLRNCIAYTQEYFNCHKIVEGVLYKRVSSPIRIHKLLYKEDHRGYPSELTNAVLYDDIFLPPSHVVYSLQNENNYCESVSIFDVDRKKDADKNFFNGDDHVVRSPHLEIIRRPSWLGSHLDRLVSWHCETLIHQVLRNTINNGGDISRMMLKKGGIDYAKAWFKLRDGLNQPVEQKLELLDNFRKSVYKEKGMGREADQLIAKQIRDTNMLLARPDVVLRLKKESENEISFGL